MRWKAYLFENVGRDLYSLCNKIVIINFRYIRFYFIKSLNYDVHMFILKNKYFFIIESTKDIDLSNIKISDKFSIIYRNRNVSENINKILIFIKCCKTKNIDFYVSNNIKLDIWRILVNTTNSNLLM